MNTIAQRSVDFRRFLAGAIGLPAALLIVLIIVLACQVYSMVSAIRWVNHSSIILDDTNLTQRYFIDMETGQRGYLVGGNTDFLQPYTEAETNIPRSLDQLDKDVEDNPGQLVRVGAVRDAFSKWLVEAQYELYMFHEHPDTFRAYFNKENGKKLMDVCRDKLADVVKAEESLRAERIAQEQKSITDTLLISGISVAAYCMFLALNIFGSIKNVANEFEVTLIEEQRNRELLSTTLLSIGDAVLVTDETGKVTLLNPIAEHMTGWSQNDALGKESTTVFPIVNETTRAKVPSPVERVIKEGIVVGLANHTVLLSKDGREIPIDDSGAPIRDEDKKLIGTVLVFRDITERRKAEIELEAMYSREHNIAESLQQMFLSKPVSGLFPGLEVGTAYRSAWEEARVGGDFYDLFAIDENQVALVLGDVSGKGLKAASRTAEIKYTLRAYLRECMDVNLAMQRLNTLLTNSPMIETQTHALFVCLTLVVLNIKTGECTVCLAGMEPPLVIGHDDKIRELMVTNLPLGIFDGVEYKSTQVTIGPQELIVATTDGITEARHGKAFLEKEGLAEMALKMNKQQDLSAVSETILDQVVEFSGGRLHDDACLLLARRC